MGEAEIELANEAEFEFVSDVEDGLVGRDEGEIEPELGLEGGIEHGVELEAKIGS